MTNVGTGKYTYELIQDFPSFPAGESLGIVSTVATDSRDRLYVPAQGPARHGLRSRRQLPQPLGLGVITDPHGMTIVDASSILRIGRASSR